MPDVINLSCRSKAKDHLNVTRKAMSRGTYFKVGRGRQERDTRPTSVALVDVPAHAPDTEPTFLSAIAEELAGMHHGVVRQHLYSARQVLEEAFLNVESEERGAQERRTVRAA
jgi:hypothetical protein